MKKNLFKYALTGILLILPIYSCIGDISTKSSAYGVLSARVKFPDKKFSIKVIPDETYVILVSVSGEGIETLRPITFDLSKENSSRIISDVPQGDKTVKAVALDSKGNLLADGQNTINVIAKQLNRVEVELKPIEKASPTPSPSPTFSPTPSPTPGTSSECVIVIDPKDLPLSKTLSKALLDARCIVVLPSGDVVPLVLPDPTLTDQSPAPDTTPAPTSSPTASTTGGSTGSTGSSNSVKANFTVIDAPPLGKTIEIISPTSSPAL